MVSSNPKAPKQPSYTPTAPYVQEPSTSVLQGYVSNVPQVSYPSTNQLAQNMSGMEQYLPASLNINNPVLSPDALQKYTDQFYASYEAPQIAQTQSNNYLTGMNNSSMGGAQLGQMTAQGSAQAGLAGMQYYTQALNNFLNARSNYFQNEGGLATNSAQGQLAAAQSNQGVAEQNAQQLMGYAYQTPQLQNQFNLSNASMQNQFNSNNYGTAAGIYGNQLNAQTKNTAGFGMLGSAMMGTGK